MKTASKPSAKQVFLKTDEKNTLKANGKKIPLKRMKRNTLKMDENRE